MQRLGEDVERWLGDFEEIVPMAPVSAQGYAQPGRYAAMG